MKLNDRFIVHDTGTESIVISTGNTEFSGGHFYLNQCQKPVGQLVTEHLLQELAGLSI